MKNGVKARESFFESELFGGDIKKILPVIEPGKRDSASLDNALEMLAAAGRSLPHAIMMLIKDIGINMDPRGNITVDENHMTNVDRVFAAGDSVAGASLVVKAISQGRKAAAGIDNYLRSL